MAFPTGSLFDQFLNHRPNGCFVMIERRPQSTAEALSHTKDPVVNGGARNVLNLLTTESAEYWENLAKANTHAPTTFLGLGINRTADLLWHGYLNAMCNSHVVLGYLLPAKIPGRADFLAYVQNS